jgi:hypothetical protein
MKTKLIDHHFIGGAEQTILDSSNNNAITTKKTNRKAATKKYNIIQSFVTAHNAKISTKEKQKLLTVNEVQNVLAHPVYHKKIVPTLMLHCIQQRPADIVECTQLIYPNTV